MLSGTLGSGNTENGELGIPSSIPWQPTQYAQGIPSIPSSLITDFGIYSGLQCAQLFPEIQAETKKFLSRGLIELEGIKFSPAPSSFSSLGTQTSSLEAQQPSCDPEDKSHIQEWPKQRVRSHLHTTTELPAFGLLHGREVILHLI